MSEASYNAANELASLEGQTLTYDADGNLTNDGTSSFSWNDRNQLTGVTQGTNSWSYAYDPLGRRIEKTAKGIETKYLYDGQNVARETTEGNTAELLNGLHPDERFARTTSAGTDSYLTDELNSTLALTGESGAPTTEYTYGPFGATTAAGAASTNPYQYTGREAEENGLQDNRARYYNPTVGRFIAQDPLGMAGSWINLYGYVGDSPMDAIDPSGMIGFDTGPGADSGEDVPGPGSCESHNKSQSSGGRGLWGKAQCTNYERLDKVEEENREEREDEEDEEARRKLTPVGVACGIGGAPAGLATRAIGGSFTGGASTFCFGYTVGTLFVDPVLHKLVPGIFGEE